MGRFMESSQADCHLSLIPLSSRGSTRTVIHRESNASLERAFLESSSLAGLACLLGIQVGTCAVPLLRHSEPFSSTYVCLKH